MDQILTLFLVFFLKDDDGRMKHDTIMIVDFDLAVDNICRMQCGSVN